MQVLDINKKEQNKTQKTPHKMLNSSASFQSTVKITLIYVPKHLHSKCIA